MARCTQMGQQLLGKKQSFKIQHTHTYEYIVHSSNNQKGNGLVQDEIGSSGLLIFNVIFQPAYATTAKSLSHTAKKVDLPQYTNGAMCTSQQQQECVTEKYMYHHYCL